MRILKLIFQNALDMLPIVLVIVVFQYLVLRQPLPNLVETLLGALLVLLGLTFFVQGLTMSLFPLSESIVRALAYRANVWLLMAFAFAIGFGSTFAEPALIAVTNEAAAVAFPDAGQGLKHNALMLRYACAIAVGLAVMIGCLRIIKGWPAHWFVIGGYILTMALAYATQSPLTAIAFDAGAAATSAINIPVISAIGVALASMISGRSALVDGFGMVALCSVMPMLGLLLSSLFWL